jgi:hypothetical protein
MRLTTKTRRWRVLPGAAGARWTPAIWRASNPRPLLAPIEGLRLRIHPTCHFPDKGFLLRLFGLVTPPSA